METWLIENAAWLQVLVSVITGLVWLVYLQLFLTSIRHQRRSMILISRGGADTLDARCFVSNMGGEPLFLYHVIADAEAGGQVLSSEVTDRDDLDATSDRMPDEATNLGPLASGQFRDIGSYRQILSRTSRHLGRPQDSPPPDRLTLTVIAGAGHAAPVVAATRSFRLGTADGEVRLVPESQATRQVRSWLGRRRVRQRMERFLAAERARLE